jgi:acetate kinase
MPSCLLILNAGSSSLKFAVFRAEAGLTRLVAGSITRIGPAGAELAVTSGTPSSVRRQPVSAPDHVSGLDLVLDTIRPLVGEDGVTAVGHRIVHGGGRYSAPQKADAALLDELRRFSPFDSEHLPAEISLIAALQSRHPNLPQVACFDTAFHHDLPRVARVLPVPRRLELIGVRRYGFHGLSYEFLMAELVRLGDPAATQGRVILAHLGNGASLAAVRDGKSVDTSMGFTPAAGLVMGSRSGDLDPGLVKFLAQREQMTAEQFDRMANHESGLIGISETSSDMRDLLACEAADVRAAEAVALFCYQARKWIGSFAAALGGLDTLVFAGGIGENAPVVRERICDGLGFLGVGIDRPRNTGNAPLISPDSGRVAVRVIHTDEELVIARSVVRVLQLG